MPTIDDSKLLISQVPVDPAGDKREPEEHDVVHQMHVSDAMVSLGKNATGKALNTEVRVGGMNAHEIATNLKSNCRLCAHWDRRAALATINEYQHGTIEQRKMVNNLRYAVGQFGDGGDGESGEAVNDAELFSQMGLCRAMTEIKRGSPVLTHFMASCPSGTGPGGEDLSNLFQLRDRAAAEDAGAINDQIMRATGAKEKLTFNGIGIPVRADDAGAVEKPIVQLTDRSE